MPLAQLVDSFQSFPCYPQVNWALLVLIPEWVGLCTFYGPVGLSNKLSCEAGSLSCCLNPHQFLQLKVLRLYFPTLEPWVERSVLLPSCSSQFIIWKCGTSPSTSLAVSPLHPSCPSLPLLLVWMNVSSLTPWLSDFHTV